MRFSALQRAENSSIQYGADRVRVSFKRFSALQRAENSSIAPVVARLVRKAMFQCSSASRKFLNGLFRRSAGCVWLSFSALQRAENSSIGCWRRWRRRRGCFSALQRAENSSIRRKQRPRDDHRRFSALQRAENSSIVPFGIVRKGRGSFSALQRAENSSIVKRRRAEPAGGEVSVLFSEPKIPQCWGFG